MVHADTLGAFDPDHAGYNHATVALDDMTNWPWLNLFVGPPSSAKTTDAFRSFWPGPQKPKAMSLDGGPEHQGVTEDLLATWNCERRPTEPGRHTSQARIERFLLDLQNGVRVLLLQAHLPAPTFSGWALMYWGYMYPRTVQLDRLGDKTPYFTRYGIDYDGDLIPFGAQVVFHAQKDKKQRFQPNGRIGLFLCPGDGAGAFVLELLPWKEKRSIIIINTVLGRQLKGDFIFPAPELTRSEVTALEGLKLPRLREYAVCVVCEKFRVPLGHVTSCTKCRNKKAHRKHETDASCQLNHCLCPAEDDDLDLSEAHAFPDTIPIAQILSAHNAEPVIQQGGAEGLGTGSPIAPATEGGEYVAQHGGEERLGTGPPLAPTSPTLAPVPSAPHPYWNVSPFGVNDVFSSYPPSFTAPPQIEHFFIGSPDRSQGSDIDAAMAMARSQADVQSAQIQPYVLYSCDDPESFSVSNSSFAGVHHPVSLKRALLHERGRAAVEKEMNKLLLYDVIRLQDVQERKDWLRAVPDAHVLEGHLIVVLKDFELYFDIAHAEAEAVWKARFVGDGHRKRSLAKGQHVQIADLYGSPMELPQTRTIACWGLLCPNGIVQSADVEQAYLNAPRRGVRTFLRLPKSLWPEHWHDMYIDPLVELCRPLYGEERAGFDFFDFLKDVLLSLGWQPIEGFFSLYLKQCGPEPFDTVMLGVHVDDLLQGGTDSHVAENWLQIEHAAALVLNVDRLLPFKFLSLHMVFFSFPDGFRQFVVHQTPYIHLQIKRFKEAWFGGERKNDPALRRVDTPGVHGLLEKDGEHPGYLHEQAASFVCALMWIARGTRPDISYTVTYLARFIAADRWCAEHARRLYRVFQYLERTAEVTLVSWIHPLDLIMQSLWLALYHDGDFAGNPHTRKSTSGYALFLRGTHGTSALLMHAARGQQAVATSPPEAETAACHVAITRAGLPVQDIYTAVSGYRIPLHCYGDSTTSQDAIRKGMSAALRHMGRTQAVSLAWLHEIFASSDIFMHHEPTADLCADVLTKWLDAQAHRKHCAFLGLEGL